MSSRLRTPNIVPFCQPTVPVIIEPIAGFLFKSEIYLLQCPRSAVAAARGLEHFGTAVERPLGGAVPVESVDFAHLSLKLHREREVAHR